MALPYCFWYFSAVRCRNTFLHFVRPRKFADSTLLKCRARRRPPAPLPFYFCSSCTGPGTARTTYSTPPCVFASFLTHAYFFDLSWRKRREGGAKIFFFNFFLEFFFSKIYYLCFFFAFLPFFEWILKSNMQKKGPLNSSNKNYFQFIFSLRSNENSSSDNENIL